MSGIPPAKDGIPSSQHADASAADSTQPAAAAAASSTSKPSHSMSSRVETRHAKQTAAAKSKSKSGGAASVAAAACSGASKKLKFTPVKGVKFEDMDAANQAWYLTSKERIGCVLMYWWAKEFYVEVIWGFTPPEVFAIAQRWGIKIRGKGVEEVREELFRQVEQWAYENPDLCEDPPGFVRKREGVEEKLQFARAEQVAKEADREEIGSDAEEMLGGEDSNERSSGSESSASFPTPPVTPKRRSRELDKKGRGGDKELPGDLGMMLGNIPLINMGTTSRTHDPPRARDAIPKPYHGLTQTAAAAASSSSSHRTLKLGGDRSKSSCCSKHRHHHHHRHRHRSSNPSSNDEGFSDGDSDREFGSSGSSSKSRGLNINDPIAPNWIRNILSGGATSVEARITSLAQSNGWSERSRHEAITFCRVIDAIRTNRLADAMEYAVRRVVGVGAAEKSKGDWNFCNMLGNYSEEQLFLDPQIYSKVQRMSSTQASLMNGLSNKKSANPYQQDNPKTPSNNQQKGKYNNGKDKPSNPENKPSQSGFPK